MKKATAEQIELYAQTKPVYPLGYIATMPVGVWEKGEFKKLEEPMPVFIEDLRGSWQRPDPVWEVVAPEGYMFDGETHTMLCYDLKDVRDRMKYGSLEPCFDRDECACTRQGHAIQRGVLQAFFTGEKS